MNNDSRYYVPDVSEFHVGFEHQRNINGIWQDCICTANNAYGVYFGLYSSSKFDFEQLNYEDLTNTRVKYLDVSDLIELGWVRVVGVYKIGDYVLRFTDFEVVDSKGNKNMVKISLHRMNMFLGTIRNKSELCKVMGMLGIKKDSVVDLDEKYQVN